MQRSSDSVPVTFISRTLLLTKKKIASQPRNQRFSIAGQRYLDRDERKFCPMGDNSLAVRTGNVRVRRLVWCGVVWCGVLVWSGLAFVGKTNLKCYCLNSQVIPQKAIDRAVHGENFIAKLWHK